jgi:N-methylhydantoinase B/oxoprolinase/acetone carboxylase alpha subunit
MAVRNMLKDFAAEHGTRAHAIDHMDDGTPIELTVDIDPSTGGARFDFSGTGPQILGNLNVRTASHFPIFTAIVSLSDIFKSPAIACRLHQQ